EKLSPLAPMVLPRFRGGRVGRHQAFLFLDAGYWMLDTGYWLSVIQTAFWFLLSLFCILYFVLIFLFSCILSSCFLATANRP
ncbi:MAG: hypothetical protein JXL67_07980, partial [Calditrichaeota bacterium]|nr:hypothetical protein [Calditrichota bacterium]